MVVCGCVSGLPFSNTRVSTLRNSPEDSVYGRMLSFVPRGKFYGFFNTPQCHYAKAGMFLQLSSLLSGYRRERVYGCDESDENMLCDFLRDESNGRAGTNGRDGRDRGVSYEFFAF